MKGEEDCSASKSTSSEIDLGVLGLARILLRAERKGKGLAVLGAENDMGICAGVDTKGDDSSESPTSGVLFS
jgi:hypothetical protein